MLKTKSLFSCLNPNQQGQCSILISISDQSIMNSKYKSVYGTNDNCMGIFTYLTHRSDLLKRPPNNRFEMRNFQRLKQPL